MSFDLDFRPAHCGDFDHPVALALNGIKGHMRRAMVRDMLEADGERRAFYDALLGPVEEEILGERAPAGFTGPLNRAFGPSWLGGEYLPDHRTGEVEIARIVLASTTMDVFSVRARRRSARYRYSVVDEYATKFRTVPHTSRRPLTMGQLVRLIDTADGEGLMPTDQFFVESWWHQQLKCGDSLEKCTSFAWVESDLYPQLGPYYEERARQWRIARRKEGR